MKNRLLALIPDRDREIFLAGSVVISLQRGKELYRSTEPIDAVYFPLDCVISIVVASAEGTQLEMATIGNEGAVGVASILNPKKAMGRSVVQVPGDAVRLPLDKFRECVDSNPTCHDLMHRYIYALIYQIMYAGACNRIHRIEERCARWLLMTHDRTGSDTFALTQEYLSEMLGVRRATVNSALGIIKTAGFIRYVRGQITVLDRAGLESASCSCYKLIRREYEDLGVQ